MHPAMPVLFELQRVDLELAEVEARLSSLDDGSSLRAELERRRKRLEDLRMRLRKAEGLLRDAELELRGLEERKESVERRLYSGQVTNPKELTALEEDLRALGGQISRAEDRVLELMDEVESLRKEAREEEGWIAENEERLKGIEERYKRDLAELTGRREGLLSRRGELTASLDNSVLSRYEHLREHLGGVAVAEVRERTCTACRVALTESVVRRLRESTEMVACENCGRLLYLPEGEA